MATPCSIRVSVLSNKIQEVKDEIDLNVQLLHWKANHGNWDFCWSWMDTQSTIQIQCLVPEGHREAKVWA
jgi:hypothetical protein